MAAEAPADNWLPPDWQKYGFPSRRWVNIVFVHTNERFNDRYFDDGKYSMRAVTQFSKTCRDYRANDWKVLDPRLMERG